MNMNDTPRKRKFNPDRVQMPERSAEERVKDFHEVPLGYTAEQAIEEAERCLMCKKSPCIGGCPVEIDIPEFIRLIGEGDFAGAIKKVKEKNLLPAICGRVCPQSEQCEVACVIGRKGSPSAIGNLERFVADWELEHGVVLPEKAPSTGRSVGIVGTGPAGLTVAGDMIQLGHDVVMYEALHEPGGVLVYGIPEFRLPKSIVAAEIQNLVTLGVEIKLDHVIGKTLTIDDLLEIHDTLFIGVGAGSPVFMNIAGETLIGVYSASEYLTRSNLMRAYHFPEWDTPMNPGVNVAVVGGGNVAMDSARTALRLGAENVYLVYRRSRVEMPARVEEIHHAEEEGIQFKLLENPVRILGNDEGFVTGIELVSMELGEPDSSGRRRPIPVEGSEHVFDVDTVIMAIGQNANPLLTSTTPDMELNRWGYIVVDPDTMETTRKGVYAGGDIVRGAATVILAMGDGRKAARAMHEYLQSGSSG
jgi:glutamate synthase (NADPH/NADH) small chain